MRQEESLEMNNDVLAELERLHKSSLGWALSCCAWNRDEAEDVLQAVYLKVLEGRAQFDGQSSFKTWLFAVIRLTALEHKRRSFIRHLNLRQFMSGNGSAPRNRETGSEFLLSLLKSLPARQQEVLDLVFYHEMTIEEAARVMGVSVGTARTHYHRGKLSLRKLLDTEEDR